MTKTAVFKDNLGNIYEFPKKKVFTIGRNKECDMTIPKGENRMKLPEEKNAEQYNKTALTISRIHATITQNGKSYTIIDNQSTAGTFIQLPGAKTWTRIPPNEPTIIISETKIRLGQWELEFLAEN